MINTINKPLISIAIPTYNRADYLKNLLSQLTFQIEKLSGLVNICVSNNCSTDNTEEVVINFQEKFPNLINYNKNETNLGADRNTFKVMEMANGSFIWLLGDDDMVVNNGIEKVITFINKYCDNNTGLIMLGHGLRFIKNEINKKDDYLTVAKNNLVKMSKIDIKNIMGTSSDNSFLSILLINNTYIKKIMDRKIELINKVIGNYFIHNFLYQLMFLEYSQLKAIRYNEIIINENPHYRKPYIEDEFVVFYAGRKKINDLLLHNAKMNDDCKKVIIAEQKKLKMITIRQMWIMKAFNNFNYNSFSNCIKLFFQEAIFIDGFFLSLVFIFFSIFPGVILKFFYKVFIKIKYKENWHNVWNHNVMVYQKSKNSRRITS